MILTVNEHIKLELTAAHQCTALFRAIDKNRTHLSHFLSWVDLMQTETDSAAYLSLCENLQKEGKEISFMIFYQNHLVGRIGIHYINQQNKQGAIGYWLTEDAQGKGIIINACKTVISYGFNELGLNRIELKAATGNLKSQSVAQKLNFKKEGILRQAELVNGRFLDLMLFSTLKNEWQALPKI